jgi:hypothetical protein
MKKSRVLEVVGDEPTLRPPAPHAQPASTQTIIVGSMTDNADAEKSGERNR